jgi:carboxyl-terminal processing protease
MLEVSIDPHTSLRPAKELQASTNDSGSSFFGIGVQYSPVETGMLIHEVTANSGAEKAGIKAGDVITAVDDKEVKGLASDQVRKLIVGPENTTVEVTIIRNSQSLKIKIVRGKIEEKVVSGKIITDENSKIGYLKISNFMYGNMCAEVKTILKDFESKNVKGIVMDLRGNPGGDVKNAQCLGGFFLGKDKVVSYFEQRTASGSQYSPLKSTTDKLTNKPLVVLINSGSASASEIMSGALQDYARALIVGQTSFGKGSYQGCGPINKSQDLVMCQTGGLFHLPSGRTNQTTGVVPDISVYISNKPMEAELYPISEANL